MRREASVLALALLPVACEAATPGPDVTVTDSAGVTIVENGAAALRVAVEQTLDPEPSLDLRSREADGVVLFEVAAVEVLPGDRIAVANGGSQEVLVFARDGALLQRLGRAGDGPGEFQRVSSAFPLGDSLAVYDGGRRRLSVFDPAGLLAREVGLRDLTEANVAVGIRPLTRGDFVLFVYGGLRSEAGTFRTEAESFRLSASGDVQASYGRFPGHELFVGSGFAGAFLFGARTEVATGGELLIVGTGKSPEVRHFAPTGDLTRIVRWPDHARAVTPERLDRFLEAALAEVPEEQRPAMRAMFAPLPHAERAPPYQDLIVSDAGDLWVGDYTGPEAVFPGFTPPARRWLVFDSTGALRSTAATPEGFLPRVVRGGEVLGVFKDGLGVESIRAYRVTARRP